MVFPLTCSLCFWGVSHSEEILVGKNSERKVSVMQTFDISFQQIPKFATVVGLQRCGKNRKKTLNFRTHQTVLWREKNVVCQTGEQKNMLKTVLIKNTGRLEGTRLEADEKIHYYSIGYCGIDTWEGWIDQGCKCFVGRWARDAIFGLAPTLKCVVEPFRGAPTGQKLFLRNFLGERKPRKHGAFSPLMWRSFLKAKCEQLSLNVPPGTELQNRFGVPASKEKKQENVG